MVSLVTLAEVAAVVDVLTHAIVLRRRTNNPFVAIRRHIGIGEHARAKMRRMSSVWTPICERGANVIALRATVICPIRHCWRLHRCETGSRRHDVHLEASSAFCTPVMTGFGFMACVYRHAVRVSALDETFDTIGF